MELVLFILMMLTLLVATFKLFIKWFELMVPFIFKKRLAELEARRMEDVKKLQDMGIELFSGEDYLTKYTSIR
ncbi:hypothetical protein [Lysinibacillus varians]|uniref:DUF4083 domain-containing protein n=1 Tax=Lysinibacillus varians TaxID=1145276 RepID=A0ABY2T455_9BACI|nr:hypothetical protein [Lysinibacillus varians]AHN24403.1 hypothetical protein T479_16915 [Lysinibacillus varians]TKI51297.1 hypothetical protein FC752_22245 [Lysinibacillus varians]